MLLTPLTEISWAYQLHYYLCFRPHRRQKVFAAKTDSDVLLAVVGFAIDQISVVPDHVHLLIRNVPKMSIETCVLMLLNNAQHFVGQRFPDALVGAGLDQLWQRSAYAGTCGQMSTAMMKAWLSE